MYVSWTIRFLIRNEPQNISNKRVAQDNKMREGYVGTYGSRGSTYFSIIWLLNSTFYTPFTQYVH